MMSEILNLSIFEECKDTLRKTSKDDDGFSLLENQNFEKIDDVVINFDLVKQKFCNSNNTTEECFKSADALIYSNKSGKIQFVEFKNGKVENPNVKSKLKDSLLIFLEIADKRLEFSRENLDYILVYNPDKLKSKTESPAMDGFGNTLGQHAKKEVIKFGLGIYKGFCYKDVFTFSPKDFMSYYLNNYS